MAKTPPKIKPAPIPIVTDRFTSYDPVVVDTCLPDMKAAKRLQEGPLLGEGGFGTVSAAIDTNLNRMVALKKLKPEHATDENLSGRMIIEAQITAQLDHPNIVPVYELGADKKNRVFFTMKLVNGQTLTDILDAKAPERRTPKDLFDGLQIFLKVCDAVAFAHAKGVIHKDLKPDNVMVGEYGEVYLMDWGFAKMVGRRTTEIFAAPSKSKQRKQLKVEGHDGMLSVTPHYLAPEFTVGNNFGGDERTDIFCLGGILYRILTGKPPYHGESLPEVARKALSSIVPPPEEVVVTQVPPRLSRIAMKALSKDPDDRYQSVLDLKDDVERFLLSGWQFHRKRFRPGEIIVEEGTLGSEAYIITSGSCAIYTGEGESRMHLKDIGVGDVFGELAVFAGQARTATVEAVDEVTVMVLEERHFQEDLGMSFWLGVVVKALADRFMDVSKELVALRKELGR